MLTIILLNLLSAVLASYPFVALIIFLPFPCPPLVIFFPFSYLIHQCGVITSSCEVAASMLLSKEEFMEIKTELVEGMFDSVNLP